jgi:antitoxin ParD1/3/4
MANTSLTLGAHWEAFIREQVASGRYASASEVVRDALRTLEDNRRRVDALRAHLSEGAEQSARGEYVEDYSLASVVEAADGEE